MNELYIMYNNLKEMQDNYYTIEEFDAELNNRLIISTDYKVTFNNNRDEIYINIRYRSFTTTIKMNYKKELQEIYIYNVEEL